MTNIVRKPVQQRSREAVSRILRATRDLLQQAPMSQLTMQRVAEVADISVASIYRYYADKGDLIYAVQDQCLQELADAVTEAVEEAEPTVESVVGGVVAAYDQIIAARALEFSALLLEADPDPELWRRGGEVMRQQLQTIVTGLERDRSRIPHRDLAAAAGVALEIIVGLFRHYARSQHFLAKDAGLPGRSRSDVMRQTRSAVLSYLLHPAEPE